MPEDAREAMTYCHGTILPDMAAVRAAADRLEDLTDAACWPFPTYEELLFSV